MPDTFLAPTPQPDNLLPAEYLVRIHPSYVFRTYHCTECGKTQPDAGQIGDGCNTGTCLWCGAFWSLELI